MPTVFEQGTAYVANLANFEAVRASADAAGVRALAIKVWDQSPDPDVAANLALLTPAYRQRLHADGFGLVGWACPRFDPRGCALRMSDLYSQLGLGGVVFECEAEYKTDGGSVDVAELLGPWRVARPRAFTAIATEGMVPSTFNHAAAIAASCRYWPESYWLLGPRYDARAEVAAAIALGWPRERVHPTLSGVEGHGMAEAIVRAYRARSAGFTHGVAIWRGDELTADDYRLLGLVKGDLFL